ncbi:hypothetical protein [Micromonospora aurantiaca (nom. illeg.)]|uniref:hypothetical protein n=1 Tax=Micromonospora aurantiaca (nom. illeg.) TaxID=47850 RepID=UPI002EA29E1B|nr:hypothetical protein [Micromonospora sp. BRA006-A]
MADGVGEVGLVEDFEKEAAAVRENPGPNEVRTRQAQWLDPHLQSSSSRYAANAIERD